MPFGQQNDEEDDLYDQVERMADRMQLKGKERQAYIHDHMTQGGYEQIQSRESYVRARREEEEGSGEGSRRWGFGSGGGGSSRSSRGNSRDEGDTF